MDSKITLPEPISLDGPPVNVPLLRKAVEWAEAEAAKPEIESEWCQGVYAERGSALGRTCDTAYCIAGWTIHAAGEDPNLCSPAERAAELLGITIDEDLSGSETSEAGALFNGGNSITDVRTAAERIAARAGERL